MKRNGDMFFMLTILRLLLLLETATAFSTGAGSCLGGEAAVGSTHLSADLVYKGSLSELTYDFQIDGESLIRSSTETIVLETGKEYLVEVKGFLARFRGALIRVATTEDIEFEFVPKQNAGVAAACDALDGVEGVTHTDSTVKHTLSGVLRVMDATDIVSLDVTVVGTNNDAYSMFGYDQVKLQFVDRASAPESTVPIASATEAPTRSPTHDPTGTPIMTPIVAPTKRPSSSPTTTTPTTSPATATPTRSPTPVVIPTSSPTTVVVPTSSPTTVTPTNSPTANRTTSLPTSLPTNVLTQSPTARPTIRAAVPTQSPTAKPMATSDDSTLSPAMVLPGTYQEHTLRGLKLEFYNVTELSVDDRFQWEQLTASWFEEYFSTVPVSTIVKGSMETRVIFQSSELKEDPDGFAYIVLYDQELQYRTTSEEEDSDPLTYAIMPFENNSSRNDYTNRLREELRFFRNTAKVGIPTVTATDPTVRTIPGGLIAAITIVLFLIVIVATFIWTRRSADFAGPTPDNIPDTFSFMGSVGSRRFGAADAMSIHSQAATNDHAKKYVIYAPSGKLLLILEVEENGAAPTVKSIQEESPLAGKIQVGDYLVAVDEVDVREMSAAKVSKLISNRRANPVRRLTLISGQVTSSGSSGAEEYSEEQEHDNLIETSFGESGDDDEDDDELGGRKTI